MAQPTTLAELDPLQRFQVRAATDPMLRARAVADPAAVLREFGMDVPAGVQLRVVEVPLEQLSAGTAQIPDGDHVLVLPVVDDSAELSEDDLTEDDLRNASGGILPALVAAAGLYYVGVGSVILYNMATDKPAPPLPFGL